MAAVDARWRTARRIWALDALRLAQAKERALQTPEEPEDMTGGWNMVDVVVGNAESTGFFRQQEGWTEAWLTAWMTFIAPSL